jgi:hypothetical protein
LREAGGLPLTYDVVWLVADRRGERVKRD